MLTLPDGTVAEFSSLEPIVPGADGTYAGVITYSGDWPTGAYSVTVRTKDGQTIPVEVATPPAEDPAPTETDGATGSDEGTNGEAPAEDGTADDGSSDGSNESREVTPGDPAPIQSAEFGFTIDATPAGSGSNGGTSTGGGKTDKGSLAQTGADDVFGIAGLGLLVALAGAGVVVGARFLGRRRDV
ncbi:hypothetical protein F8O01_10065 [Pseudoclavibacter chungangensis]|uniref:LPXTG cell wall anchor domain-containing protein n=1 Tax=Pseudoclavibacter chungangensis TaxID=587635 RepID=A0A7J5BR39_9MICO|nr:hypothetical protein F8O01_10065 [Pseudoclavibacter chungangensis]